ncbi:putative transcription factor GTE10-like [Capsicum annuum]|uniref:uncharacterized protein LOC107862683 n=1 Tax=Capsicum annuum TaxID=4072 RepID=UPI001FB0B62F|nr:uncharacterized protein LOC107862683 [Capsicum annuum]KAF3665124.1 putative transcription factor GTE10-like [Capsicum annuum]
MDGRGGCCIARYAAGGGGAYDMSKVDRIMLRYRPIAPKPAAGGSVSGATTPPQKTEVTPSTGRWKRRYVKDHNKNGNSSSSNKKSNSGTSTGRKRKAASPEENESSGKTVSGGETVVTLPLLSESPERKEDSPTDHLVKKNEKNAPIWLSFGGNQGRVSNNNNNNDINGQLQLLQGYGGGVGMDRSRVMFPQPVRVVGSWVKVESVTDAWVEVYGLGRTDEEKFVNLGQDTCPGFISDGLNRVRWANKAYKDLVGDGGPAGEVVVWLVMKEDVPLPESKTTAAFTCKVRVVRCGKEKNSLILPCDVWRMDGGGFAWRLDTEAALSLGRWFGWWQVIYLC